MLAQKMVDRGFYIFSPINRVRIRDCRLGVWVYDFDRLVRELPRTSSLWTVDARRVTKVEEHGWEYYTSNATITLFNGSSLLWRYLRMSVTWLWVSARFGLINRICLLYIILKRSKLEPCAVVFVFSVNGDKTCGPWQILLKLDLLPGRQTSTILW